MVYNYLHGKVRIQVRDVKGLLMEHPHWTLPEEFYKLPTKIQGEIMWCLNRLPSLTGKDVPPLMLRTIETLHHNARTGTRYQNVLFQHDWDILLNGRPHVVDLARDLWYSSVPSFRTKVYREASARCLDVRTKVHVKGMPIFVVQALEFPDAGSRDLTGCQLNPPWYRSQATREELAMALVPPLPDPPVPVPASDPATWPEEEDLGPCSCGADSGGADMPHAPSCSIW